MSTRILHTHIRDTITISVGLIQYAFMLYAKRILTTRLLFAANFTSLNRSSDWLDFCGWWNAINGAYAIYVLHLTRDAYWNVENTPSALLRMRVGYIAFFRLGFKSEPQICERHMS